MKKPFLLLSLLLTFGLHADCAAWGTVGHRAIAEVAQRHLTPKAKAAIERYTGGTPLAEYAVFMDEVAADPRYKEPFRGWHASIADAECNSPAEVREKYRKGRDGVTGAETLTAALKNYRELDDSVVLTYIKCIVHMVADFHCLAHVRYTDAHQRREVRRDLSSANPKRCTASGIRASSPESIRDGVTNVMPTTSTTPPSAKSGG